MPRPTIPDGSPMSPSTLYRRRKAAGQTIERKRRYFDESFFEKWSPELAWLLGLIWSDGNLSRKSNQISIVSKDRSMLDTVASLINIDPEVVRPRKNPEAWVITFASKRVADRLRTLGLTPAKSLIAVMPPIPTEYEADFWRGMFDGDGWAHLSKSRLNQQSSDLQVGICGAAPEIFNGYKEWLDSNELRYSISHRSDGVWRIVIYHQQSLRTLYNLLYHSPDVPCLDRKRHNFTIWYETPRAKPGRRPNACDSPSIN